MNVQKNFSEKPLNLIVPRFKVDVCYFCQILTAVFIWLEKNRTLMSVDSVLVYLTVQLTNASSLFVYGFHTS